MKTQNITVKLRDGEMGAYLAIPDRVPAGAIIAIMEIWGVNDTMRHHAHEFAQAGFICLVPDLASGARRRALRRQSAAH
jgi:carboxymethylenebutenolidase